MKIAISGANGMLGQDLISFLKIKDCEIFPLTHQNMDITNSALVNETLSQIKPDVLIHCAAYTNVDEIEDNFDIAYKINVEGTKNLALALKKLNATMVYISTDYVFDGEKTTPYQVDDKTNPINKYGFTKLQGEKAVQETLEKYYIVRTSWLYGKNGKNFVETMLNLKDKPELKVVDDQKGCPTWTKDLANAIWKVLKMPYGIYHGCSKGETTWFSFAKEIFKLENLNVNLKPCTTKDFSRKAKRPKYSVMENSDLIDDWKIGLSNYLKERKG